MTTLVQTTVILASTFFGISQAWAGADCKAHPKAEWMDQAKFQKDLEGQGYKIKKFKIDGECYEIYGWDKAGKKVEIYFDTKDGSIVKSKELK